MDANELKYSLSDNDIYSFLQHLGGDPYKKGDSIISRTICHNPSHSGSHKLYYKNASFHCFTQCSCSYDIYSLVEQIFDYDFKQSMKYVQDYFGYNTVQDVAISDKINTSFFDKFNKSNEEIKLPKIDSKILNIFSDEYYIDWVKDNIMPSSMARFNIKLDTLGQRIIIPTYSHKGDLIGIRVRNLQQDLVDKGLKYLPLKHNNIVYNFPMGNVLYGLYENKENIERIGKVVIFESEKSVLALDSYYHGEGVGVAVGGSSLSNNQLELIKNLNISEVIIAMDKEWNNVGEKMERYQAEKIKRVFRDKLDPYFNVSCIYDIENLLSLKDSPTDKGFDTWQRLWDNRIYISNIEESV